MLSSPPNGAAAADHSHDITRAEVAVGAPIAPMIRTIAVHA
jgi:hypothetical protein